MEQVIWGALWSVLVVVTVLASLVIPVWLSLRAKPKPSPHARAQERVLEVPSLEAGGEPASAPPAERVA